MNSFKILNILDSHDEKANIDSVNVCGADNLHNLRDDSVITKKDEESEQRTDNSLVIRFGYPFPKAMTKGPFFQHFIDKFASMGVAEYTKMQCKILDEMIGGNSFQVTGSGVTCGAGKTSLTIGATVGLFQHGDKVIIVNKPWTNEALSTEISDLVGEFSGGRARLGYCGQKSDISQVVRKSDVIIATTREIERIADVLINGNVIDESCNVTVVFDEAHTIFNRREYDTFDSYMKGDAQPQKPHMTMVFEALAELFEAQGRNQLRSVKVSILSAVGDVNTAYEEIDDPVYEEIDKAHKELEHGHLGSSATGSVKKTLNKLRKLNPDIDKEVTKIRNFVSLCPYCIEIEQCRLSEKHGSDWERYYEEPKPLPKLKVMVKEENPSDIIEHAFKIHLNVDVTKIISEEFERQVHTYIFDIRRRGCEKIGGVTMYYDRENQPKPLIYETMLGITFNWLVDGRLLFVIRRAQLGAMTQLLDEKLSEDLKNEKTGETLGVRMCEYYTYTADKKLWNVQDSDGRPCFNIVIVCDDELDNLQGINFVGVRAVYLFTLGDMWNMPKKLQALGRAGRLGQGVTYQFVMFDKASNKNAEKERLSSQYFRQLMAERETKQIVTVDSEKILEQSLDGLPDFKPTYKEYFFDDNASKATAQAIKESVRMANLPQVCKHLKPGPSGKPHMCDRALTHKCHWYHPTNSDIYEMKRDKPILLKPNLFNLSYCSSSLYSEPPMGTKPWICYCGVNHSRIANAHAVVSVIPQASIVKPSLKPTNPWGSKETLSLRTENAALKARVAELQAENSALKRQLSDTVVPVPIAIAQPHPSPWEMKTTEFSGAAVVLKVLHDDFKKESSCVVIPETCQKWAKSGNCSFGEKCKFKQSHTEVCRDFQRRACTRGADCQYLHVKTERKVVDMSYGHKRSNIGNTTRPSIKKVGF